MRGRLPREAWGPRMRRGGLGPRGVGALQWERPLGAVPSEAGPPQHLAGRAEGKLLRDGAGAVRGGARMVGVSKKWAGRMGAVLSPSGRGLFGLVVVHL